jgi:hypothetical protein
MPAGRFFQLSLRPWGIVTAAGAVAVAATVLGFLGSVSWLADLFAHFRVQYAVGLAAASEPGHSPGSTGEVSS